MQIDLSEEQRLLRDTCREFADKELKPNAKKWDREHRFPAEAVKKAFELGLGGVAISSDWGGAGTAKLPLAPALPGNSPGGPPSRRPPRGDHSPSSPPPPTAGTARRDRR